MQENETFETSFNDNTDTDYIQAIKDLKQNTVSKDQYNKVKAENKKLLDSIINGTESIDPNQQSSVAKESIAELRTKLLNRDSSLSNLEYISTALELRNALLEAGEEDPFVPQGKKTICTEEDRAAAQRVADVFEQCVTYADGDSMLFTNELMRRTNDVHITKRKK